MKRFKVRNQVVSAFAAMFGVCLFAGDANSTVVATAAPDPLNRPGVQQFTFNCTYPDSSINSFNITVRYDGSAKHFMDNHRALYNALAAQAGFSCPINSIASNGGPIDNAGTGMTFELRSDRVISDPDDPTAFSSIISADCHGYLGSCNPYHGEQSCNADLPVLCINDHHFFSRPSDISSYWSNHLLASTHSRYRGYQFGSLQAMDQACVDEFGQDWRAAEFHDGGAWRLWGYEYGYSAPHHFGERHWMSIDDQNAECWHRPPECFEESSYWFPQHGNGLAIPDYDYDGVLVETEIENPFAEVHSVRIDLEIEHTYIGDLWVSLVAPSGAYYSVWDGTGGGTDDLVLEDFEIELPPGEVAQGTWGLHVFDDAPIDTGYIEFFQLKVEVGDGC